jgi:hypothetical protein
VDTYMVSLFKTETSIRALILTGLVVVFAATPVMAFHENGVGNCSGCHVIHGSVDGQPLPDGAEPLLLAPTATDLCLMCHGGHTGVFGHNPLDPPAERGAGNFVFLLEDNINDDPNGLGDPAPGESAGHSIISLDYGVGADTQRPFAPGGNFPSDQLGCTSCHDPHGNSGFRMLNGIGPVQGGLFDFINPAPVAVGLDVTDPLAVEALDLHTAYQSGVSDWCANCHGLYHERGTESSFDHSPDEALRMGHINAYNQYNGTSEPHGGLPSTAYLPAVPFEGDKSRTTSTAGPIFGDRVMCLSCHRAHASSAPHAGRWDFNVDLLDEDGVPSGSWPIPNPYNDSAQTQLCAKCHRGQNTDLLPIID